MNYRNFRRGAAWGYGLGLLALLAVVGLMVWMTGPLASVHSGAGGGSQSSYQGAIDRARAVTQAASRQSQDRLQDALNAANPPNATTAPATDPGTGR